MSDKRESVNARSPVAGGRVNSPIETPAPRYQYTEYELHDATIAMVQDISDPTAWIQSNVTYSVEQ